CLCRQWSALSAWGTPLVTVAFLCAPLCPSGHLPHEGGDQPAARLSQIANLGVAERTTSAKLPISPPGGGEEWSARRTKSQRFGFSGDERPKPGRRAQSGRTEGGNVEHLHP